MNFKDAALKQSKESSMREVLHKTTGILNGRGKVITLREHAEETECITDVQKNFIYLAAPAVSEEAQPTPRVHLKKSFDSISRDEKFCFRVKGAFYVSHGRQIMKVDYCHSLRIKLHWKIAVNAPKKTVTMA
jgi:3-methyladenine DNA glycosylase Mpg